MPARPRSVSADALRLLVVALCALPLLSALAGSPAARLSSREVVLPHVNFTAMVKLTVIGMLKAGDTDTKDSRQQRTSRSAERLPLARSHSAAQAAPPVNVAGSLPLSASKAVPAIAPKAAQPPPPPGYPSCFDTVQVRLRVAGYTQKVLGDTTPGGQLALLKQITAGCNASIRSDQVAVQSLFNAKKTSVQSSDFMFWGWLTPAAPGASILKNVGYGPTPIAQSMKSTYKMTAQQTSQMLKDLGYGAAPNMQALKDVFGYGTDPQGASQIIKNDTASPGPPVRPVYTASENGLALKAVFPSTTAPQMSLILFKDGYTAPQNGQALVDVFPLVTAVVAAGYLKTDGYNAKDVGTTLRDVYHVTAAQMAQIFRDNGYSAHDNAVNLRDLFAPQTAVGVATALAKVTPPYSITDITAVVKDDFAPQTPYTTVYALWSAGFDRDPIAAAVKNAFGLTVAGDLAKALNAAYGPCNTAIGTKSVFTSLDGPGLATALKSVFSSAADVTTGLDCVFPTLKSKGIAPLLKGVSFDVGQTAGGLKSVFSPPDSGMADALNNVYPINDVADTVKTSYSLDFPGITKAMKGGNFGAPDIGGVLASHFHIPPADGVNAFSLAGFGGVPTADVLKNKFGVTDPGTAVGLLKAKYDIGAVTSGMTGPYQLNNAVDLAKAFYNNFDPEAVAKALGDAFQRFGPDAVKDMFNANYPLEQVDQALKNYIKPPDEQIAKYLHDAGFGINDIGPKLKSYFDLPKQTMANALGTAGATATEAINLLKGSFDGINDHEAATLLKVAGTALFPLAGVASALGSIFGLDDDDLEDLMEDIGFDGVADFFSNVWCGISPTC